MDDCLTGLPLNEIEEFHEHENCVNFNMQFTSEKEEYRYIPSLDMVIIIDLLGNLSFGSMTMFMQYKEIKRNDVSKLN